MAVKAAKRTYEGTAEGVLLGHRKADEGTITLEGI